MKKITESESIEPRISKLSFDIQISLLILQSIEENDLSIKEIFENSLYISSSINISKIFYNSLNSILEGNFNNF